MWKETPLSMSLAILDWRSAIDSGLGSARGSASGSAGRPATLSASGSESDSVSDPPVASESCSRVAPLHRREREDLPTCGGVMWSDLWMGAVSWRVVVLRGDVE